MSDLPDLPPGWAWRQWPEVDGAVDLYAGGVLHAFGLRPDDLTYHADEAHDAHDSILRAASEAVAADAGVVLPDDYDPAAVLRDGVRAQVRA